MSTDYLAIEPFLKDALHARTLQAAFEIGLIDALLKSDSICVTALLNDERCDHFGRQFLIQTLVNSQVLQTTGTAVGLTEQFRFALQFRDLMETKLQFAQLVANDFFEQLPQLMRSSDDFMATSRLFELFDYGRCQQVTPQSCLQAARWMQLTTMLTRYEAPVCSRHFDFQPHRAMLDLGGNSGEFAVQVCRHAPSITATVADLPAVCEVGKRHVSETPEAPRIAFHSLNFMDDALPDGFDLITCKSVLHDWPEEQVEIILNKSLAALPAGGTFLLFERMRWDFAATPLSYGHLPVMLFFRSYRQPGYYVELMNRLGFADVVHTAIQLEVPFMLVSGKKPRSGPTPAR
jgi:O-methyltransferase domain